MIDLSYNTVSQLLSDDKDLIDENREMFVVKQSTLKDNWSKNKSKKLMAQMKLDEEEKNGKAEEEQVDENEAEKEAKEKAEAEKKLNSKKG